MNHCQHLAGWEAGDGEERCPDCGTRRFTEYGALRPKELPSPVTPSPHDAIRADRTAAIVISRTVRHLSHWGRSRADFWRCPAARPESVIPARRTRHAAARAAWTRTILGQVARPVRVPAMGRSIRAGSLREREGTSDWDLSTMR
ncbi:DUF6255 family natural product biosynthesis protein [Streptomyces sp. AV19]|uniref:DUF6255 family natural product biosynthesis protein n=1 Tax=Streptomyces sp. AV19 TaxID=2793068 RepID=UPI0035AB6BDE